MAEAAIPHYRAGLGNDSPRYETIRRIFMRMEPGRVLDVGCADGCILGPCTGRHEIHGVDICKDLVSQACARGLRAQLLNLEERPLPYPDGHFGAVHCGETIEHITDTDWILSELNRVLAPGGTLVLTFPNVRTLVGLAMLLADIPPMFSARYRAGHFRDFTLRTMRVALRNNGFAVERAMGSQFWLPLFGDCLPWLARFLPSWSSSIIVIARKVAEWAYDGPSATADAGYRKGMWR